MSPITAPSPSPSPCLTGRAQRYCDRARTLRDDPSLTMDDAACALGHLQALQDQLRVERRRITQRIRAELDRIEAPFRAAEDALSHARADLSEALLHAIPSSANLYGRVPHGVQQDAAINREKDTTPAPAPGPQAASVCRALVDLEALRPYLNSAALSQAVETYTKDQASHDLPGVAYVRLPVSANLPCAVL